MGDILPLLSLEGVELLAEDAMSRVFASVFMGLISMPGASWAKTSDMKKKFGIE